MKKEKSILTPQQIKFLDCYTNPKSKTFSNALQSALKVGYKQEYAESITHIMPKWLSENIGDSRLLNKALRNLDILLDEEKNLNVKADITKFVAKTLGREKFGDRLTVDNNIKINDKDLDKADKAINKYLDDKTDTTGE